MKKKAPKRAVPDPDPEPITEPGDEEAIEPIDSAFVRDKGLGPSSAGQSGDTQGLSDVAAADSESVQELIEEGQFFEAAVIQGVEDAPDADVGGIRTRQLPEDDVPLEYDEEEKDSR